MVQKLFIMCIRQVMSIYSINLTVLAFAFITLSSNVISVKITSQCGFPGQPVGAPPKIVKPFYKDGEEVVYENCPEYYYDVQHTRTCVNGKWDGLEKRCGTNTLFSLYQSAQFAQFVGHCL